MGKNFMGYNNASELITAIGNKIKAKYTKPNTGIPKSDLASGVQTSLGRADSALQSETDPTVPTWAKQESKPSYHSDEISDTNKTHKFATQAQLNQIGTNQTNILYVADSIGKNILDWSILQTPARKDACTVTDNSDGSRTFSCSNVAWARVCYEVYIPAGTWYISQKFSNLTTQGNLRFFITETSSTTSGIIIIYGVVAGSTDMNRSFVSTGKTYYIWWYLNYSETKLSNTVTVSELMLCTEAAWNISHAYEPYALPNSDLTRLEAEDRNNILYNLENGAKNLLKLIGDVVNPANIRIWWNYADGTVRVTGSTATTATIYIYLGRFVAPETGEYVLSASGANVSTSDIYVYDDGNWNTTISPVATWTEGTVRQIYIRIATGVVVGDITIKPMICLKSVYDFDSTVLSHALPNQVLTPALIDIVDSGTKNLWNFANAIFDRDASANHTKTDSDITVKSTGAWGMSSWKITLPAGTYTFRCKITNLSVASGTNARIRISDGTSADVSTWENTVLITANGIVTHTFTTTGGTVYIQYYATYGNASSTTNTFKASENMICTKTDWNASNKFVPYRAPIAGVYSIIRKAVACSTTETTTGIKFTSTESACYRISVTAMYAASKPLELKVKQKTNSSDTFHAFLYAESTTTNSALSVSGLIQLGVGGELEVFAKYETAADNYFYVIVEKIG